MNNATSAVYKSVLLAGMTMLLTSCGGGGGGDSSTGPESSPSVGSSGSMNKGPVTISSVEQIAFDLVYVIDLFNFEAVQAEALFSLGAVLLHGQSEKLEEQCENAGSMVFDFARLDTETLSQVEVDVIADQCLYEGQVIDGQAKYVVSRYYGSEEDTTKVTYDQYSLAGLEITGDFSTNFENSDAKVTVNLKFGDDELYLENFHLPQALWNRWSSDDGGIDRQVSEERGGTLYDSTLGRYEITTGETISFAGGLAEFGEVTDWPTTEIQGEGDTVAEFVIGNDTLSLSSLDTNFDLYLKDVESDSTKFRRLRFPYEEGALEASPGNASYPRVQPEDFWLRGSAGTEYILNARNSIDDDGQMLEFLWSIKHKPANSRLAEIEEPASPITRFSPDVDGIYTVTVKVFDGEYWSEEKEVEIEHGDVATPAASFDLNITRDESLPAYVSEYFTEQKLLLGLDGNGFDFDGYQKYWEFQKPSSSNAELEETGELSASFVPDVQGTYVIKFLAVAPNGSKVWRSQSVNVRPLADLGPRSSVTNVFILSGSASLYLSEGGVIDVDSYDWEVVDAPAGSAVAGLSGQGQPTIQLDAVGRYTIRHSANGSGYNEESKLSHVYVVPESGFSPDRVSPEFQLPSNDASVWTEGHKSGDLNGDGLEDVVIRYGENGTVKLAAHLQESGGNFSPPKFLNDDAGYAQYYNFEGLYLQDIDGDAKAEILLFTDTQTSSGYEVVIFQYRSNSLIEAGRLEGQNEHVFGMNLLAYPDVNGDGLKDVLLSANSHEQHPVRDFSLYVQSSLDQWERVDVSDPKGLLSPRALYRPSGDVVVQADGSGELEIVLLIIDSLGENEDQLYKLAYFKYDSSPNDLVLDRIHTLDGWVYNDRDILEKLVDLNQDGNLDVIAANHFPGERAVFYGIENGTTESKLIVPHGSSLEDVFDIDGDGNLDLVYEQFVLFQDSSEEFLTASHRRTLGFGEWINFSFDGEPAIHGIKVQSLGIGATYGASYQISTFLTNN